MRYHNLLCFVRRLKYIYVTTISSYAVRLTSHKAHNCGFQDIFIPVLFINVTYFDLTSLDVSTYNTGINWKFKNNITNICNFYFHTSYLF